MGSIWYGTEWLVYYNNSSIITNVIPTTISGLTPNTLYNCHVSAVCGPGDTSSLSTPTFFTTACAPTFAPINENFDAGFSPCWSQDLINDDFDWELEDGGTPSNGTGPDDDVSIGGNYMYTEASAPRQDGDFAIMYSEEIDLSTLTNPEVRFTLTCMVLQLESFKLICLIMVHIQPYLIKLENR